MLFARLVVFGLGVLTVAGTLVSAVRTFVLKPKKKRIAKDDVRVLLGDGSCLVMRGRTQLDWRHGIPAEPNVTAPRVNLTFRKYRAIAEPVSGDRT